MPEVCDPTFKEGAAEGRSDDWGEVVTRQPYRKVRLDHLLSREETKQGLDYCLSVKEQTRAFAEVLREAKENNSSGDALTGDTRTHTEHDG